MKVWGTIEEPKKIEFVSYSSEYRQETLEVIRNAFFPDETVSIASEIAGNREAENDLLGLVDDCLAKTGVSLLAREVESGKIVAASINLIQTKEPASDAPTYFETFRDTRCKTENAKNLMSYMITADSRVDAFEKFNVDALLEVMFLATLKDFRGHGIGFQLVKHSVELAAQLKAGIDCDQYLAPGEPTPKIVAALMTGRETQKIAKKLNFKVIFAEPFSNYTFRGRNFAERVGDLTLGSEVVVARL